MIKNSKEQLLHFKMQAYRNGVDFITQSSIKQVLKCWLRGGYCVGTVVPCLQFHSRAVQLPVADCGLKMSSGTFQK